MREFVLWEYVFDQLQNAGEVGLLVVVESTGSSPGRLGFKMVVAKDGGMKGSIGGGIMEQKLVEYMRSSLIADFDVWEVRRQIHSKDAARDQSGMICSGEQKLAILRLKADVIPEIMFIVDSLREGRSCCIQITDEGFSTLAYDANEHATGFKQSAERTWQYSEVLGIKDIAHVIGAGHVGLEMCRILSLLDFFVVNYDDRPGLNTMEANTFAHRKVVLPYPELGRYVAPSENAYVIVMTFGYRGDDQAIRALIGRKFKYFGMMGSEAKVTKLLADLRRDGYSEAEIQEIRTPAGLVAHCKTPAEIAVSVAAEMIAVRNGG
ncbi:MAG: XdhC family protein [Bacteroidetes bacterium]|nr:XdhC family protein [Bacteroidota bacterium]